MNITSCSVKVMRSYDYCHFEVCLGVEEPRQSLGEVRTPLTPEQVDELRKTAARLADKAVEQYKKRKEALEVSETWETRALRREVESIMAKPEGEHTPEDKAAIKRLGDIEHAARFDYDDEQIS